MPVTPVTAGIIRVSSDSAEQAQSPENQREHLVRAGCTKFYEDKISGSAEGGEKRRQSKVWQQLEADIKARRVGRLLVCEVNRIARRDHLVMGLVELCDEHGIEFLATTGGALSAKSAPQWLSLKQQAVFAEYFAREQSDKIRRGQESCRQRGVFGFSSSHLAWHLQKDPSDSRKVIAHPDRWNDARAAALDYAMAKATSSDICKRLFEKHGICARPATLTKWLKSPWLRGHYGKRDSGEILIANIAPPLVTEAEAELIQERLKLNAKGKGTRAPHKVRPLSGLARCCHCEQVMTSKTIKRKTAVYNYLKCGNPQCSVYDRGIRAEVVEMHLKSTLGTKRLDFVDLVERQRKGEVKPTKELLNLRLRAKKLEEALAIVDSPGVRADYEQAQHRIAELEEAQKPSEPRPLSVWEQLDLGSENWWNRHSDGELNTAFRLIVEAVWIDVVEGKLAVDWKQFD